MSVEQTPGGAVRPSSQRARILVLVDYYLPGSKFGGPIRTLSNLVSRLGHRYEFFVFTTDRDEGDAEPYREQPKEQWTGMENAKVYYTPTRSMGSISRRISEIQPDIIYLNSFFSRATMRVLVGRRLGRLPRIPILLAPRGEFADGALAIKPGRKKAYIRFVNVFGLLEDVTLQASTELEKKQMERHLTYARRTPPQLAQNISDPAKFKYVEISKQPGALKVVFLSRVSRNKNLDGALRMLQGLQGQVEFSICGPINDAAYYKECENLMWRLPQNIAVRYLGDVPHERVSEVLAENHLMFLPSHGENFGHAIAEALAAGRPVLISDRTPWRGLEQKGVGADLALEQEERFTAFLQEFVAMEQGEFSRRTRLAREYAIQAAEDPEHLEQNVALFEDVLRKGR